MRQKQHINPLDIRVGDYCEIVEVKIDVKDKYVKNGWTIASIKLSNQEFRMLVFPNTKTLFVNPGFLKPIQEVKLKGRLIIKSVKKHKYTPHGTSN